jgi:drug/metabolite transporter (DMT)-like permease
MFGKWIEETPHRLENNEIMRVRQWLAVFVVMAALLLNVVMLLNWAFNNSETEPKSLVNFARAMLIFLLIAAFTGGVAFLLYLWAATGTGKI